MNDLIDDRIATFRTTALGSTVVCPSCSMHASTNDRRLFQPLDDASMTRRCRNCQAVIDLSSSEPRIAAALA